MGVDIHFLNDRYGFVSERKRGKKVMSVESIGEKSSSKRRNVRSGKKLS